MGLICKLLCLNCYRAFRELSQNNIPIHNLYYKLPPTKCNNSVKYPQGPKGTIGPQGSQGIQGPEGPRGPTGPQGIQGKTGPTGPQGIQGEPGTGVKILGSYNNFLDLASAHPTGQIGDAYLINGDLYVWSQNSNNWNNVGRIQGPEGLAGSPGPMGPRGDTGPTGPTGNTGNAGAIGPQGIQGNTGPTGPQGIQGNTGPQGEKGDTGPVGPMGTNSSPSRTIIPFASQSSLSLSSTTSGTPRFAYFLSFVSNSSPTGEIDSSGRIVLTGSNQVSFSLPYEAYIESVYVTIGNNTTRNYPDGLTVYPYVQLYSAPQGSNTFAPLYRSIALPNQGYNGRVPVNTVRTATVPNVDILCPAGTRIIIGGAIITSGSGNLSRTENFYFTGGIGIRSV